MEHRVYNTGDQVWLRDNQVVRVITSDGLVWSDDKPNLVRVNTLYKVTEDGSQSWFCQRYDGWAVTKIVSADGQVWSEEDRNVQRLKGAELVVHRVQTFLVKLILKILG